MKVWIMIIIIMILLALHLGAPQWIKVSAITMSPSTRTTYNQNLNLNKYNCPHYLNITQNSATFSLCSIPKAFSLSQLQVDFIYNGTGYTVSSNGTATMYPGYSMIFNLTLHNKSMIVAFAWAPPCNMNLGLPCFTGLTLPSPNSLSVFNGTVTMNWYIKDRTLYLTVLLKNLSNNTSH